jgi:hypothetical protein
MQFETRLLYLQHHPLLEPLALRSVYRVEKSKGSISFADHARIERFVRTRAAKAIIGTRMRNEAPIALW